jgi:RimJ/RimL family protein N-acetyltransferase
VGSGASGCPLRIPSLLVQFGRDEGLDRIVATILPENREMQYVAQEVGFTVRSEVGDECRAELVL